MLFHSSGKVTVVMSLAFWQVGDRLHKSLFLFQSKNCTIVYLYYTTLYILYYATSCYRRCQLWWYMNECSRLWGQDCFSWVVSFLKHSEPGPWFKACSQPWVHKMILCSMWIETELFMCSHSNLFWVCVLCSFYQLQVVVISQNMSKSYFTPNPIWNYILHDNSAPFRPFLHINILCLLNCLIL